MQATIDRKALSRAITTARRTTGNPKPLAILSTLLVRPAGPDSLEVIGTDLEVCSVITVKASIGGLEGDGCEGFAIDAKHFGAAVKGLRDGDIVLSYNGEGLHLSDCGGATLRAETANAADFPVVPEFSDYSGQPMASYPVADFRAVVDHVLPAASVDETRYNICSVYLEAPEGGGSIFVATDGHRLAHYRTGQDCAEIGREGDRQSGIMLPRGMVDAIGKAMGKRPGLSHVSLFRFGGSIAAHVGQSIIYGKAIDGEFPAWRQVVPVSGGAAVSLPREAFIAACRSLQDPKPRHPDAKNAVKLAFGAPGHTPLAMENAAGSLVRIDCAHPFGEAGFQIGFNARYLLEGVGGFDGPDVILHFAPDYSGGRQNDPPLCPVRLTNGDDWDRFAVVMPMRL